MAWPGTLTTEEQPIVVTFDTELRDAIRQVVKGLNRCSAVYEWYWRQIGGGADLISKLGTDDVIPTGSGLAGITKFTKAELVTNQMAYVEALMALNDAAHRDHYRLAIGGPNMSQLS